MPLDPQVQALLDQVAALNVPPYQKLTVQQARDMIAAVYRGEPAEVAKVEDRTIPGPGGPIPVRIYTPAAAGPLPLLVFFHGGGWVIGNLDSHDVLARDLANGGSCVVVSVDYRLAPEHTAPAPVVDGYDALQWLTRESAALGIAPGAVGVCGLSAGGGIAAAVTLMARDRGGLGRPAFQMLLSPALDDRMHWPSCRFEDVPLWNRADTEAMWERYLGSDPEAALPYGAPGRAKDLHDLPPAYVTTGELDPMRDAAIDYATRLLHAGVSVELHVFPGAPHGWDMFCPKAGLTKRALAERVEVVRRLAGLAISSQGG